VVVSTFLDGDIAEAWCMTQRQRKIVVSHIHFGVDD
jgi:hypothetical protein